MRRNLQSIQDWSVGGEAIPNSKVDIDTSTRGERTNEAIGLLTVR
jgi:hypothetical protein